MLSLKTCKSNKIEAKKCRFCSAKENNGTDLFRSFYGIDDMVNGISDIPSSFAVLHDFAPLGSEEAHLLLIPYSDDKQGHISAFSQIRNANNMKIAIDSLVKVMRALFPQDILFFFEHGSGMINNVFNRCGNCHVYHAHSHFLPLKNKKGVMNELSNEIKKSLASNGWHNPKPQISFSTRLFRNLAETVGRNPYLYFGALFPDRSSVAYTYVQKRLSYKVESQLIRRAISKVIYKTEESGYWHWNDISLGLTSSERSANLILGVNNFVTRLRQFLDT